MTRLTIDQIDPEDFDKFHVVMTPKYGAHNEAVREKYFNGEHYGFATEANPDSEATAEYMTPLFVVLAAISAHNDFAVAWSHAEDHGELAQCQAETSMQRWVEDGNASDEQCAWLLDLAYRLGTAKGTHVSDDVANSYYGGVENCEYWSSDLEFQAVPKSPKDHEGIANAVLDLLYMPLPHDMQNRRELAAAAATKVPLCHGHLHGWPDGDMGTLAKLYEKEYLETTHGGTTGKIGDGTHDRY